MSNHIFSKHEENHLVGMIAIISVVFVILALGICSILLDPAQAAEIKNDSCYVLPKCSAQLKKEEVIENVAIKRFLDSLGTSK